MLSRVRVVGLLVVAFLFSFFAAGASAQAPQQRFKIGVSIPAADHGWTAGVHWWAKRCATLYLDVDWSIVTAVNPEKQIADIEDMMAKKVNGLVILATESAPLTPVAERARQQGIYIVNVDRGFLKPVANVFIEGDNKAFGRKAAEFMVQKLGGRGDIVILEGIPSTVNSDRVTAFNEVIKAYPNIRVLGQQPAMWNREKGMDVMQNFLAQFPKIDAVWAGDDDVAMGAIRAIRERGREKEMFVFPGAGMKEVVKMIMDKDPLVPADITYPPSMIATGMHICVSSLRDGKEKAISSFMPKHLTIDVELITPDNAKDYYFPQSIY